MRAAAGRLVAVVAVAASLGWMFVQNLGPGMPTVMISTAIVTPTPSALQQRS